MNWNLLHVGNETSLCYKFYIMRERERDREREREREREDREREEREGERENEKNLFCTGAQVDIMILTHWFVVDIK